MKSQRRLGNAQIKNTDIYIADKILGAVQQQTESSRKVLTNAIDSLAGGDVFMARQLLALAATRSQDARTLFEGIHPSLASTAGFSAFPFELQLALTTTLDDKTIIDAFLKDFKERVDKLEKLVTYRKGGTFEGSDGRPGTTADPRKIVWRFYPEKASDCKCICLVSVFHFRDKDGRIARPAVKGYKKDYVENNGSTPDNLNALPHGGFDVKGYAVDTPFYTPKSLLNPDPQKPVKCPCYPGQYKINDKGQQSKKGTTIGGTDAPYVKLSKFTEHFETAAICFDKKPYVILNSMRWKDSGKVEIEKGKIDQGDASLAFKFALEDWIRRAKMEHKIKDIECCKDK